MQLLIGNEGTSNMFFNGCLKEPRGAFIMTTLLTLDSTCRELRVPLTAVKGMNDLFLCADATLFLKKHVFFSFARWKNSMSQFIHLVLSFGWAECFYA